MKEIKVYYEILRVKSGKVQEGAIITYIDDEGERCEEFIHVDNEADEIILNNWISDNKDGGSDYIYDQLATKLCTEDYDDEYYSYFKDSKKFEFLNESADKIEPVNELGLYYQEGSGAMYKVYIDLTCDTLDIDEEGNIKVISTDGRLTESEFKKLKKMSQ